MKHYHDKYYDLNINFSKSEMDMNEFVIFQIKNAKRICHNMINEQHSIVFQYQQKRIFPYTCIGLLITVFMTTLFNFDWLLYVLAGVIVVCFIISSYIYSNDQETTIKNIYNSEIAYKHILHNIDIIESEEKRKCNSYSDVSECDISFKFATIRNFFRDNYRNTVLYLNITNFDYDNISNEPYKKHIINSGRCMCCGEFGAKKLSNKHNDFLLCDLCYKKESLNSQKECK